MESLTVAVVLVHFGLAGAHGVTHLGADVPLSAAQVLFIGVVIAAAPFLGLWLHRRSAGPVGALVIALSMAGSLLFGVAFHFVADTPDRIDRVDAGSAGSWALPFGATAYAVAGLELTGTVLGLALLRRRHVGGRQAPGTGRTPVTRGRR